MLDIGWSEMLMVAVVAIIVIGPKDLPKALRSVGQWVGKARSMAREFQNSVDDMVRDSELSELRESANKIANFDYDGTVDPTGPSAPPSQSANAQPVSGATQLYGYDDDPDGSPQTVMPPEEDDDPHTPAVENVTDPSVRHTAS